jgi:transcription termination factor Rho
MRNRGPRRPRRPGGNPNIMMRPPQGAAAVDVEVLSEADLAAEGLLTFAVLANMTAPELIAAAKNVGITVTQQEELSGTIQRILTAQAEEHGQVWAEGILEIVDDGYGFIRRGGLLPSANDVYVPSPMIRRIGLRQGDTIGGVIRAPREGEKFWGMLRVEIVSGTDPESARRRPHFGDLTPIHPIELINLETVPSNLSQRLINLVNPIGKGQRALIVSPPKAGKTSLLKQIAQGVTANYPEISLMVCLIGERPEEVTDMRRSVKGEVISSTFDEPTENHTHVAEMALEIAKRRTEAGADVVVLLDSITRLARAYNLALPPSGRTLSGGIDPIALYPPKRFFGAARKLEEGGSLTIIGTCLVDTGSKMDDVIYEEFKGTGNSELVLDRKLAEKRIFPAVDVQRSGTRREELLLDEATLKMVWTMRRMLSAVGANEGIELLLNRIAKTESNAQFLASLTKGTEGSSPS